ncbi:MULTISPECIES: hypothetical protein [Streptococcus]|uniref:hypothetical protein n=1 Tax=Streptococcus TaxID=1301 RepID=UPI00030D53B1|nr:MULTISPECIES: hypothetical protein [Streptococcus]EPV91410.1 hypothetical protein SAG0014_12550 [Streptococcus agalactiae FSL S3-586]HEK9999900.1 hypothetical protein [Streptococcus equi subsp. zooepidemicus]HEL0589323.1 hypothetical protein [Streptococcus equi subsp. zooepidemicus]HEL0617648.1 hypothetical protein [Streptococcus equi subsp. zooepidemicus]HEL0632297.1 hypothetical protein [Streptococcus equi subsp. zooepidemicus]
MAKKDLTKIDRDLEEARKKVADLENEKRQAEENLQKQIGKLYVQIQLKKDKSQSYETILDDLKTELELIKQEEKARREEVKNRQLTSSDEH